MKAHRRCSGWMKLQEICYSSTASRMILPKNVRNITLALRTSTGVGNGRLGLISNSLRRYRNTKYPVKISWNTIFWAAKPFHRNMMRKSKISRILSECHLKHLQYSIDWLVFVYKKLQVSFCVVPTSIANSYELNFNWTKGKLLHK